MSDVNQGFQVSGGTVEITNLAVGSGAQVVVDAGRALDQRGLRDLHARLDELMDALAAHREELAEPARVAAHASDIARELAQEVPSRSRLDALLEGLGAAAGPIAGVASAVGALLSGLAAL